MKESLAKNFVQSFALLLRPNGNNQVGVTPYVAPIWFCFLYWF